MDRNDTKELMVTIWCITYNHEPYIRQCLESFVMQNTNFRFEAIVHDDASTDGTTEIIKEYANKYPDIIKPIFEFENQYSKRDGSIERIMIKHMRGKYVAMCEGDDYWIDPFKLQKQVDFLECNKEYSLCFHNAVEFYEGIPKIPKVFCKIADSRDVTLEELIDSWIVPTASMFLRRTVFDNYPEWTKQIYSGDLTLQLISYDKGKIYYMNQIMSFYRKIYNGNSVSVKYAENMSYVLEQHALLLHLYNEYTDYRYTDVLARRISHKEKSCLFIKYRKINLLYAFLRMPFFCFSKLRKRMLK